MVTFAKGHILFRNAKNRRLVSMIYFLHQGHLSIKVTFAVCGRSSEVSLYHL